MPHRQLLSAVAIALTNLLFMPVMAAWQVTANSNSASLSANTSHPTFREQIVFVRANPSLGVSSVVSITDVNGKTGDTTGRHDAPQFQATASANFKRNEIALMNPDGSDWRVLHVYGSDPALSPDGTKIAYCSVRESIYSQVYVMNIDGTAQKRLTKIATGDSCGPAWSHDGRKIAFYAFALTNPSRNPEIWLMNVDGSDMKRLTDQGMDPSWSPDDRQIAFASDRENKKVFQIYAINADGSSVRRLTNHKSEDSNPAWAPDGAAIAYISETEGDRRGLFLMAADGSQQHRLAFSKQQDFCFPAWSLDGKEIAFTALNRLGPQGIVTGEERPHCELWSGEYQIFTFDGGGSIHRLTDAKLMGMRPSYGRVASR